MENKIVEKKKNLQEKTDSGHDCFDRQYLDGAKYSSYKQVGVLVNIQDSERCGWVGASWSWHHASHWAFQRIYGYGTIQAVAVVEEKEKFKGE